MNVFDISAPACQAMKSAGATVCATQQEVAKKSDFVVTMLPNNDIVAETYETMISDGVNAHTIFIDSSTIDPNVVRSVQKKVAAKGARFVDAPVSGGVPGAEHGTLTFMVGGTKDEFEAVSPILEGMGKKLAHCGSYGMGQAAKICNNMMLGISMVGISEVMNLAIRLGLDPKQFMEIINSSTGRCWASEVNIPVPGLQPNAPSSKNYDGGFQTGLITKDLGLASAVATASNSPIPMGAMAHQIYRQLMAHGKSDRDFSVVYDFLKNQEGK